ncbi:MAG: hypothetical protein ACR2N5_01270 [Solirubrobacterales bacterium]
MYRYPAIALGILSVFVVAACQDTPGGSDNSPAAGAGTQGIGRFSDETPQEAVEAPVAEAGVVPDVLLVTVGEATAVIEESGFEVEVEGGGVFGLTTDTGLLICSQMPVGGEVPDEGSTMIIEGQKTCPDLAEDTEEE